MKEHIEDKLNREEAMREREENRYHWASHLNLLSSVSQNNRAQKKRGRDKQSFDLLDMRVYLFIFRIKMFL